MLATCLVAMEATIDATALPRIVGLISITSIVLVQESVEHPLRGSATSSLLFCVPSATRSARPWPERLSRSA